jgi:tetratricopeptide (TPR) repeat protein
MTAALVNLGNAYFNKKKYDSAIEEYKKAVRIKPDNGTVHYNIAAAYHNKGYFDKAAVEYEKAIEIDPQMADAHNGLAFAYYKLKDYESAWQHIKKAEALGVKISPDLLSAIKENLP